jgi:Replication-relaxation
VTRVGPSWADAERVASLLDHRDWRTLRLVGQLPLVPTAPLADLLGSRSLATAHRALRDLREAGLAASAPVISGRGRPRELWHLTDLGVGVLAIDQGAAPDDLARDRGLGGGVLRRLLLGWPQLVASYELLAAVARSRPGEVEVVTWERPWIRTVAAARGDQVTYVKLPTHAVVAWTQEQLSLEAVLVADLGEVPIRVQGRSLARLVSSSRPENGEHPFVLVAAPAGRRSRAWQRFAEQIHRGRGFTSWLKIVSWSDVHTGDPIVADAPLLNHRQRTARVFSQEVQTRRQLPHLVGATSDSPARERADRATKLTPSEREALEVIGRHPFLPLGSLAVVLGWAALRTRDRCRGLVERGLARVLELEELGTSASLHCVELTADGLGVLARLHGLTPAVAVRQLGLAGGGPQQPLGNRSLLLRDLAHTLGADAVFVHLIAAARRRATERGTDDALVDWRGAAACARNGILPDGYGVYRARGDLYGFLLEYDRGTMRARDYRRKLTAYYRYRDTGRFQRDYAGFPTILVVTSGPGAENRIARVLSAAAVGRQPPLPVLLTTLGRIDAHREGLLGQIWREPGKVAHRAWQVPIHVN